LFVVHGEGQILFTLFLVHFTLLHLFFSIVPLLGFSSGFVFVQSGVIIKVLVVGDALCSVVRCVLVTERLELFVFDSLGLLVLFFFGLDAFEGSLAY
jgi:hypothetical protein